MTPEPDATPNSAPEPVFEAPWHAQVFALTVHLNESGRLPWPDWAARFGAVLKRHGLDRSLNGGEDYFNAWLEALEQVLEEMDLTRAQDTDDTAEAWRAAYLATPHGQQVVLPD